jgi:hypothetical protein
MRGKRVLIYFSELISILRVSRIGFLLSQPLYSNRNLAVIKCFISWQLEWHLIRVWLQAYLTLMMNLQYFKYTNNQAAGHLV